MGRMHSEGILEHAPHVLKAFLRVLESLAVTEAGARSMFVQLQDEGMRTLSWSRMFQVMIQYCQRYSKHPGNQVCD